MDRLGTELFIQWSCTGTTKNSVAQSTFSVWGLPHFIEVHIGLRSKKYLDLFGRRLVHTQTPALWCCQRFTGHIRAHTHTEAAHVVEENVREMLEQWSWISLQSIDFFFSLDKWDTSILRILNTSWIYICIYIYACIYYIEVFFLSHHGPQILYFSGITVLHGYILRGFPSRRQGRRGSPRWPGRDRRPDWANWAKLGLRPVASRARNALAMSFASLCQ